MSQKFEVEENEAPFSLQRLLSGSSPGVLTVQMAAPSPCATELAPSACSSAAPYWLRAEVWKEPAWLQAQLLSACPKLTNKNNTSLWDNFEVGL